MKNDQWQYLILPLCLSMTHCVCPRVWNMIFWSSPSRQQRSGSLWPWFWITSSSASSWLCVSLGRCVCSLGDSLNSTRCKRTEPWEEPARYQRQTPQKGVCRRTDSGCVIAVFLAPSLTHKQTQSTFCIFEETAFKGKCPGILKELVLPSRWVILEVILVTNDFSIVWVVFSFFFYPVSLLLADSLRWAPWVYFITPLWWRL